jgi:hypothetical protein
VRLFFSQWVQSLAHTASVLGLRLGKLCTCPLLKLAE